MSCSYFVWHLFAYKLFLLPCSCSHVRPSIISEKFVFVGQLIRLYKIKLLYYLIMGVCKGGNKGGGGGGGGLLDFFAL